MASKRHLLSNSYMLLVAIASIAAYKFGPEDWFVQFDKNVYNIKNEGFFKRDSTIAPRDQEMETDMNKKYRDSLIYNNRMESILKRQADRKKSEKNGVVPSNLSEVEKFTTVFNEKQKKIEKELQDLKLTDQKNMSSQAVKINAEIQELQKLYSNATLFLRIYDKKVFQESLQGLQTKLQNLENELMPKKKFGFKVKKNNVGKCDPKIGDSEVDSSKTWCDLSLNSFVGLSGRSNENLTLEGDDINKRDVMLRDLENCSVWLKGAPTTVHATNLECCKLFFGPVITSVFLENVKDSVVHLACQQLRIHDTFNTDFYVHVTSKSVIENCKNVRFGSYDLDYDGLDKDYEVSGLSRQINNWNQVDDFNWLITSKPSPNWSIITKD